MLVLERVPKKSTVFFVNGHRIEVSVSRRVTLFIKAPDAVNVVREEVLEREARKAANGNGEKQSLARPA